jgi:hypothetical protein
MSKIFELRKPQVKAEKDSRPEQHKNEPFRAADVTVNQR